MPLNEVTEDTEILRSQTLFIFKSAVKEALNDECVEDRMMNKWFKIINDKPIN